MSGEGASEGANEKPFYVDRAKTGRAACKKCKQKINTGDLRLGKLAYNPFASGTMKLWHHVTCMFEVFKKQRKTTKRIDTKHDIGGWDSISKEDQETIKGYLTPEELANFDSVTVSLVTDPSVTKNDDSFRVFRKICSDLTNASSYLNKTEIVKNFFTNGSSGDGFNGDILLWCRSLLPMAAKRVYNLQSKQLVKIFSDIFGESHEEMLEDLEKGDVAETIGSFFEKSSRKSPAKKAILSLSDVDCFLEYLARLTRETDQKDHFDSILPKCTVNDLKMIIRLIKHDLRINAGPKHILQALHPDAYEAFQASRNLEEVVKKARGLSDSPSTRKEGMAIGINLMTPVLPMLAEPCTSVDFAFKRCPNGMFSEIKYDGERVQLHKEGDSFKYFSRSLKPVVPHKVKHFSKYIPQAFPHGKDLILDSEILMMDTKTGQPLPFGTLGIHKRSEFQDATVCLFVFDCLYFNGKSLLNEPIVKRRKVLQENMTEISNRVMFSDMKEIHKKDELKDMIEDVLRQGLEGLVVKGLDSVYEPGKRHWLKVKKDYLLGGSIADSADLMVLGAWYGTGKKGGIMSIFLMGCYDEDKKRWVTVTKVHGGHDDKTLESLQTELKMVKISKNSSKVPSWLHCNKTMIPDFVAEDPKSSQVWEVTGAEFTCNQVHTANGISIRFPRVTRIRHDKDWKTATSLSELKQLYVKSKDTSKISIKEGQNGETEKKASKAVKSPKDDIPPKKPKKPKADRSTKEDTDDSDEDVSPNNFKKQKADKRPKDDSDSDVSPKKHKKPKADKRPKDDSDSDVSPKKHKKTKADKRSKDDSDSDISPKKHKKPKADKRLKDYSDSDISHKKQIADKPSKEERNSEISPKKHKNTPQSSSSNEKRFRDDPGENKKVEDETSEKVAKKLKYESNSGTETEVDEEDKTSPAKKSLESPNSKMTETPSKKKLGNLQTKKAEVDSGSDTEVDEDFGKGGSENIEMENELPNVFVNCVILLHDQVPNCQKVRRYIIAYGGRLYSEERNTTLENSERPVTHVVYVEGAQQKLLKGATEKSKHVSVKWIWDSISKKRQQNESSYELK